jgi:hypothetical protein
MGDEKLIISSFGRHVKPLVLAAFAVLTPTNPHWACVADYGPLSFCVIDKEGLCPSSGDINRLMMMDIGNVPKGGIATLKDKADTLYQKRTSPLVT